MLKRLLVVTLLLLGLICFVTVIWSQQTRHSSDTPERIFVGAINNDIRWMKTGKGFVWNSKQFECFDISTRKTTKFPGLGDTQWFDISPDGKSVVYSILFFEKRYNARWEVRVRNLSEKSAKTILRSKPREFGTVFWISKDLIGVNATVESDKPMHECAWLIDRNGKLIKEMKNTVILAANHDGRGILCSSEISRGKFRHFYYDVSTGDESVLPDGVGSSRCLYLSSHQLVYLDTGDATTPSSIKTLEFRTMKVRTIELPEQADSMILSPDLTKYYLSHRPRGEWGTPRSYVVDIPEQTRNVLQEIESGR